MGIVRFYSLNAFNDAKFKAILESLKKVRTLFEVREGQIFVSNVNKPGIL